MALSDRVACVRVELEGWEPPIWRRLEVPLSSNLRGLHDAIQAAMPFDNCHLFMFEVGDRRFGIPSSDWGQGVLDAKNIKLGALMGRGISELSYTYDFGDDWRFSITIEGVEPTTSGVEYPRFVDDVRRAPPEEVGGTPGFNVFLDAIGRPDHERHDEWLGRHDRTFDPDEIDRITIEARMAKLARRRALGKAAYAKVGR